MCTYYFGKILKNTCEREVHVFSQYFPRHRYLLLFFQIQRKPIFNNIFQWQFPLQGENKKTLVGSFGNLYIDNDIDIIIQMQTLSFTQFESCLEPIFFIRSVYKFLSDWLFSVKFQPIQINKIKRNCKKRFKSSNYTDKSFYEGGFSVNTFFRKV